jgi:hypothetical protein
MSAQLVLITISNAGFKIISTLTINMPRKLLSRGSELGLDIKDLNLSRESILTVSDRTCQQLAECTMNWILIVVK